MTVTGQKANKRSYPNVEGLTAETTKQTGKIMLTFQRDRVPASEKTGLE